MAANPGYLIGQAVMVGAYAVMAVLLLWQCHYFFGSNKVSLLLLPQLKKALLLCAGIICIIKLILLPDPFGVCGIYPIYVYIGLSFLSLGVIGIAAGSYVYYTVRSAFQITFQRPISVWRYVIFTGNCVFLIAFCGLGLLAATQSSVQLLVIIIFLMMLQVFLHFVISVICHLKVIHLLTKFLEETPHREYLMKSRRIIRHKLLSITVAALSAMLVIFNYGYRYIQSPNKNLTELRSSANFEFLDAGLIELWVIFITFGILYRGWISDAHRAGEGGDTRTSFDRASYLQSVKSLLTDVESVHGRSSDRSGSLQQISARMDYRTPEQKSSGLEAVYLEKIQSHIPLMTIHDTSSILNADKFEAIWSAVPENLLYSKCELLFSLEKDGSSFTTFFDRTRNKGPTIIVLKTSSGEVIGGFASHSWQQKLAYYGTGETFLFAFQPHFVKYSWSEDNELFMLSINYEERGLGDKNSFLALGGGDDFGLKIDAHFSYASSGPCKTFNSPSLLRENSEPFKIHLFEVWGFDMSG